MALVVIERKESSSSSIPTVIVVVCATASMARWATKARQRTFPRMLDNVLVWVLPTASMQQNRTSGSFLLSNDHEVPETTQSPVGNFRSHCHGVVRVKGGDKVAVTYMVAFQLSAVADQYSWRCRQRWHVDNHIRTSPLLDEMLHKERTTYQLCLQLISGRNDRRDGPQL